MKKTILLSTLLASVALASTTGFVESYIENETEFGTYEKKLLKNDQAGQAGNAGNAGGAQSNNGAGTHNAASGPKIDPNQKKPTEKKDEPKNEQKFGLKEHKTKLGVKTQVNIKDTGFSFGADIKGKDLKLFKFVDSDETISSLQNYLNKFDDNSNVWAKLTLPEYNNFIMSGKLKVGAKYKGEKGKEKYVVPVTGEAEFKTMYEENTFKFLTKTTFNANKDFKAYEDIRSEHTISVETAHPMFKNSKLSFSVEHDYGQEPEKAVKNLRGQALVYYNAFDKLSLDARSYFKYRFGATELKYFDFMLEKDVEKVKDVRHLESVIGEATYKANTKTNLIGKLFIQHFKKIENAGNDSIHDLKYGAILGVKYNNKFGMNVDFNNVFAATSENILDKNNCNTLGYWKTKLGLKYNINAVKNKLIVSPELVLSASVDKFDYTKVKEGFKMLKDENARKNTATADQFNKFFLTTAEVEPKLTVAYTPVKSLTLTGFVSAPAKFINFKEEKNGNDTVKKSALSIYYTQVVKSGLNIKYVW